MMDGCALSLAFVVNRVLLLQRSDIHQTGPYLASKYCAASADIPEQHPPRQSPIRHPLSCPAPDPRTCGLIRTRSMNSTM